MKKLLPVIIVLSLITSCASHEAIVPDIVAPARADVSVAKVAEDDADDEIDIGDATQDFDYFTDERIFAGNWEDPDVVINTVNGEVDFKLKEVWFCSKSINLTFEHEEKCSQLLYEITGYYWCQDNPNEFLLKFKDGKTKEFFDFAGLDHNNPAMSSIMSEEHYSSDETSKTYIVVFSTFRNRLWNIPNIVIDDIDDIAAVIINGKEFALYGDGIRMEPPTTDPSTQDD